ncbi:bifunctional folylpolyglutamate synthase/dihydrofolate synthase, partial [Candidatus Woesearchaeota archaeon]|nr:bifunctional folylpolyglutamate synthase/dihydrofolate synthase [Candidatus Woesearchaeota archaeon]
MNYRQALQYLYSIDQIKLGLSRMKKLLKQLGNPEQGLQYIHVAGTDGKGSACAMLESILLHAGYSVGKYISPHLKDFTERITINKREISRKDVVRLLQKIIPLQNDATYFEIVTAMAFLYFQEKKPDIVILEVGLGGRLDATNVVTPLVSVITNISLEHTEYLGNTIKKIAREKAGIIKQQVPIVTANRGEALAVIHSIAKKRKASYIAVRKKYQGKIGLRGAFQKENAALAYAVAKVLKKKYHFSLTESQIKAGIAQAKWPGRMDLRGNVLFDCAHTEAGFKALSKELNKLQYRKLILVLSLLSDKRIHAMLPQLIPFTDAVIVTKSKNERAGEPKEIASIIQRKFKKPVKMFHSSKKALQYAKT